MDPLTAKYAQKLVRAGMADPGAPLIGWLDAEIAWNRDDPACVLLERLFGELSINSLLFCRPAEPYRSIMDFLAEGADGAIRPKDAETRTFLHDLPVVKEFDVRALARALKKRKSVTIPGGGVVTLGTVSPEQAFVTFSSVCFACFVKFFSDGLADAEAKRMTPRQRQILDRATGFLDFQPDAGPPLRRGPFSSEDEIVRAICESGRATVEHRLVDSFFGNISYRREGILYISQTGSSLDELEGCIDPVPLDGSATTGLTASSELTAHREVVLGTGMNAILHGHPKFSVILSMDCDKRDCPEKEACHTKCPEKRHIEDVPVVPGEVGTGRYGLARTLPPAMANRRGVIVYGHGLFTVGRNDFTEAFGNLLAIERMCREKYDERLKAAWKATS